MLSKVLHRLARCLQRGPCTSVRYPHYYEFSSPMLSCDGMVGHKQWRTHSNPVVGPSWHSSLLGFLASTASRAHRSRCAGSRASPHAYG